MKPVSSAKSSRSFLRDECSSGHCLASPGEAQLAMEWVSVTSPTLDALLGFPILLVRSQRAIQDLKHISMAAAEQLPPARRALGMLAGTGDEMRVWQPVPAHGEGSAGTAKPAMPRMRRFACRDKPERKYQPARLHMGRWEGRSYYIYIYVHIYI